MRHKLRIFLAATFEDLEQHRRAVADLIVSLSEEVLAMEFFYASSDATVEKCKALVLESDVVVVLVGRRYGWVPSRAQGGDGRTSITELEVRHARALGRPLLAFVSEERAIWEWGAEQDDLMRDPSAPNVEKVGMRIRALEKFRQSLSETATPARFSSPDSAAQAVLLALVKYSPKDSNRQHIAHDFERRVGFIGRTAVLEALAAWYQSKCQLGQLTALGGGGKTAVVCEWLHRMRPTLRETKGLTLFWSFTEQPDPSAFARTLARGLHCVLHDESDPLGAIWSALEDGRQHLIVVDGLEPLERHSERNQVAGGVAQAFLARFLTRAANSRTGNWRLLVTSRTPHSWPPGSCRIRMPDLSDEAARGILLSYDLDVSADILARLAGSVGNHALSVHVVGSYVSRFGMTGLDGRQVADLKRMPDDMRANALTTLLRQYSLRLRREERDLLAVLATFPGGLPVRLSDASAGTDGSPVGTSVWMPTDAPSPGYFAKWLEMRGMVHSTVRRDAVCLSAHPALRDWFRPLYDKDDAEVERLVRSKPRINLARSSFQCGDDSDFLVQQLGLPNQPSLAPYTAWWFNIVNFAVNECAVQALDAQSGEKVLEVGFGGGIGLRMILGTDGVVAAGVDASAYMVKVARETHAAFIRQSRLALHRCVVGEEELPYPANTFHRALSVSAVYFWKDGVRALRDILRVLRPGGRLVLGIETKNLRMLTEFRRAGYLLYSAHDIQTMLDEAGYVGVESSMPVSSNSDVVLVAGEKPG